VKQFTGRDSAFEPPEAADLILNTEKRGEGESLEQLYRAVQPRVSRPKA